MGRALRSRFMGAEWRTGKRSVPPRVCSHCGTVSLSHVQYHLWSMI